MALPRITHLLAGFESLGSFDGDIGVGQAGLRFTHAMGFSNVDGGSNFTGLIFWPAMIRLSTHLV